MATTKSAAASITVLMGAHNRRSEVDGVAQLATVDSVCTPTVNAPAQAGEGRTNPAVEAIAVPMQSNRAIDPPATIRPRMGSCPWYRPPWVRWPQGAPTTNAAWKAMIPKISRTYSPAANWMIMDSRYALSYFI
jgi:hypothetical protein